MLESEAEAGKKGVQEPHGVATSSRRLHLHEGETKMPAILKETSVAAGAILDNLWQGSAYEFARSNSIVSIGVTQSATGGFATIQAGPQIVAEEFSVPIKTIYPVIPDEMYFNAGLAVGDRLVTRYRNPTAGALTIRGIAQITEV